VKVVARVHADCHVEEAAAQRGNGAGDNAECVYVNGIHGAEQTVWIQRKDRSKKAVVVHVREFFSLTRVFNTSDSLQVGPVREPVIISGSSDLTDDKEEQ